MNFKFTPEQEAFRSSLRAFLDEHWSEESGLTEPENVTRQGGFNRRLAEAGYLTMSWPTEYGGRGAGPLTRAIYSEEVLLRGAPYANQGVSIVGPALMVHGTPEQKERFISGIAQARDFWCQGFSEPGAGSDLASLQTKARRDGDEYVVNGQKIWTSNAWRADYMHLLVRTDPDAPKHKGISYLLVDMKSEGVSVRRIPQMSGGAEFCEVFFEDVRVPVANRIGDENRGWYIATTSLDYERSGMLFSTRLSRAVDAFMLHLKRTRPVSLTARGLAADAAIAAGLARLLSYRVAWLQENGQVPNHEASAMKLFATEALQRFSHQALGVHGIASLVMEPGFERNTAARTWLDAVSLTIAGGTSEVQRNIVATRGLGLPRT